MRITAERRGKERLDIGFGVMKSQRDLTIRMSYLPRE